MELKFFKCKHCGQIVAVIKATGAALSCCGEEMKEIKVFDTDGAKEKHVPVYSVKDGKVEVSVGSVEHPMTEAHYIEWILLQTKFGNQRVALLPNQAPKATFALVEGDEVQAVYAYCNLHSLWKV